MNLKDEILNKTSSVLAVEKITPKSEDLNKFIDTVDTSINRILKYLKRKPEEFTLTISHDKNSKNAIPVMLKFARKK